MEDTLLTKTLSQAAASVGHHEKLMSHPMVIVIFGVIVLLMLALDLGVFNKKKPRCLKQRSWNLDLGLDQPFDGLQRFPLLER
jgi:hypothetical protein